MSTRPDFARIGPVVVNAGQLVELQGDAVLATFDRWRRGPRAANLDPDAGGWRYEEDADGTVWPVPADSTGEAAIRTDRVDGLHGEYERAVNTLYTTAARIVELHRMGFSPIPPREAPDPTDWCRPHMSIGVAEPRFRGDLCRWCRDFKAANSVEPPRELLLARHRGDKITSLMVDQALGRARNKRRRAG